jgi:hypothetical protein
MTLFKIYCKSKKDSDLIIYSKLDFIDNKINMVDISKNSFKENNNNFINEKTFNMKNTLSDK